MSDQVTKLSPAERIAAAQAKRDALQEAYEAAHQDQYANDLEVAAALEEEHGTGRVRVIRLKGWREGVGAATLVVVKLPNSGDGAFKRHEQAVAKAKTGTTTGLDSAHTLVEACLLYPSRKDQKELYDATFELAPGLRTGVAAEIVVAVQGKAEEEKKD